MPTTERASLSCPLHPSKSHAPSKAQGPSPESTAPTVRERDGPLSSFHSILCWCHHFTDGADGLKCRLCMRTLRVIPVRELRTKPAPTNVPTSFSPLTFLLCGTSSSPPPTPGPHRYTPAAAAAAAFGVTHSDLRLFFFSYGSLTHCLPLNSFRKTASGRLMPVIIK